MRAILLASLALCGCATQGPHLVFEEATEAFADGAIEKATSHFSSRLKEDRHLKDLERYYADEKRRNGVRYLLGEHQFSIKSQDADRAVGEVVWRTGRREPVHFVLEQGVWKLDLPPEPIAAGAHDDQQDHGTSGNEPTATQLPTDTDSNAAVADVTARE